MTTFLSATPAPEASNTIPVVSVVLVVEPACKPPSRSVTFAPRGSCSRTFAATGAAGVEVGVETANGNAQPRPKPQPANSRHKRHRNLIGRSSAPGARRRYSRIVDAV